VQRLGVIARPSRQAAHGGAIHLRQPRRLSHATTLVQVFQDRQALVVGELGAEQGRALAFAEALLADPTAQQPTLVLAVTGADV
jgi:hypothetical protein